METSAKRSAWEWQVYRDGGVGVGAYPHLVSGQPPRGSYVRRAYTVHLVGLQERQRQPSCVFGQCQRRRSAYCPEVTMIQALNIQSELRLMEFQQRRLHRRRYRQVKSGQVLYSNM